MNTLYLVNYRSLKGDGLCLQLRHHRRVDKSPSPNVSGSIEISI